MLLTGGENFGNGYEAVTEILTFKKCNLKKLLKNVLTILIKFTSIIRKSPLSNIVVARAKPALAYEYRYNSNHLLKA